MNSSSSGGGRECEEEEPLEKPSSAHSVQTVDSGRFAPRPPEGYEPTPHRCFNAPEAGHELQSREVPS